MLANLQKKLAALFGGGKKSTGGGKSSSGLPSAKPLITGVILVVLVIWGLLGFYRVDQAEQAVVLRFGKYQETVGAGLHWHPVLIDEIIKDNVTQVRSYRHEAQMLTEDENIVDVKISVQYTISNLKDFLINVTNPQLALDQASVSALRHVVGNSTMDNVLAEGRAAVGAEVLQRLQSYLDNYGTGIQVQEVTVEDTHAPSEVQAAFDDVIKAREDEQRLKNQAEAYANGLIPEARGEAIRRVEDAKAYKARVVSEAQGQTQRFTQLLKAYKAAPQITRERLYLDALQSVLAKSSKVLIDTKNNSNLLYLPLDKLIQRTDGKGYAELDPQQIQQLRDQVAKKLQDQPNVRGGGR
jgi:membrane protease subunit HflK